MDLDNPCTTLCTVVAGPHPERGEPLRFELGPDGSPRAAVLWIEGTAHPITKPVTVLGRKRGVADVILDDPNVSRRAAVLRICAHGVLLEDFGAGTWVAIGHQRVGAGTRLFERDEIHIGPFVGRLAHAAHIKRSPSTS